MCHITGMDSRCGINDFMKRKLTSTWSRARCSFFMASAGRAKHRWSNGFCQVTRADTSLAVAKI